MKEEINVLIPSGHSSWALPVINCLSYYSQYKLFLLSAKKSTATKYSRYISYYKFYDQLKNDNERIKIINEEVNQNSISLVIPLDEEEIIFFIKNSDKISKLAKIIPLSTLASYEKAIDKCKFNLFLQKNKLPHPNTIPFSERSFLNRVHQEISFPALIKPCVGQGGKGIVKFNSLDDFNAFYNKNEEEYVIQEYVEGYDIDCSVLCSKGNVLAYTIQKCNLYANNPYSQQLGVEFLDNKQVLKIVKELMAALDWSGIAHVDLRYDEKSKSFKIIEINARVWGSIEASLAAGVNFPILICQLAFGKKVNSTKYKHIKYMRIQGFIKNLKKNPLSIFNFKLIFKNTGAVEVLRDPLPSAYKVIEKLRKGLNF